MTGTLNPVLMRLAGLTAMALVELTWLAIRVEVPSTGFLSYFKGFPSIFVTSLAVVTVLVWASSRGKLLELPVFQDLSHNPWFMVMAHLGAFGTFFWLTIFVAEGDAVSSPLAVSWVLAWAATGLGAGVFWMLAAMPALIWIRLARQNASLVWAGIIIIAASWILGYLTNRTWEPLMGPTFLVVEGLLLAFRQEVFSQPAGLLLGTPQFAVEIYPACAGYEGIGLISVFVGSYLWFFRGSLRFPQAFILLPCGILVIWLVNAVRITLLILFGAYVSPQIALGGFHSSTGWIGFLAVAMSMVAVTRRVPFFAGRQSVETEAREGDRTAAYLGPLMTLLAIMLVTGVFSSGFDWFYPVRVLGTAAASGSSGETGWPGSIWRASGPAAPSRLARRSLSSGWGWKRPWSPPPFTWLSFLLSSFLFGALHGRWLAGTVAGMFYAWAMYRRGRVADAIMAHATTNALIAAEVLLLGSWNLWN